MAELPKDDAFGVLGLFLFHMINNEKKRNTHEEWLVGKAIAPRAYDSIVIVVVTT
jgi:hypothetical protein